ncbi:hypothetical protein NIES4071_73760 [Calothrix sp. NIES-4071]|nr:hypothetical protein NIES4071_73760 [Calothrix sp. NIES-4071]BAZ61651.1 hypothetical protein NIES4105_73710 [Calothrix sp. NIES-4105]
MWTEIDTHISKVLGTKFETVTKRSVSGGCINQGYSVSNGQHTYFVKINQASYITMFSAEALGLQQMYDTHTIRVPKPLCWGSAGNQSYIVMEWLEIGSGGNKAWKEMGRHLAAMHKVKQNRFGWDMNNTIGSTTQINTWTDSWVEFYTEHRLGYQFKLGRRKGGHFQASEELLAAIPELLAGHEPYPSLVHGDLWGGNAGCTNDGTPVIFDPATYYGDREVDIAMTELFGGFSPAFYRGYNEVFPLDEGYEQRKVLYNLYHIVNHFNLFGGSYESQANRMISQILR